MKITRCLAPGFFAVLLQTGCGSSNDDSKGLELGASNPPPVRDKTPQEMTKEELLKDNLDDMIYLLESQETPLFFERYIEYDTVSKVEVHNFTFPEKKSLQTMYDEFEKGIMPDLLKDLKVCQTLTPEFVLEEDGWYSVYYFDENKMSAEVLLGYHPEYDDNWDVLELPLTLPWGNPQTESRQWLEWESTILKAEGASPRDLFIENIDPHLNPAALIAASQVTFNGRGHSQSEHSEIRNVPEKRKEAVQAFVQTLTPQARQYEAAILARRLLTHQKAGEHIKDIYALLDQFGFDRTGIDKGFKFKPLSDIPFYMELSDRFPDQTDWPALIAQGIELYRVLDSEPYPLYYPFSASQVHLQEEEGGVSFTVTWSWAMGDGNIKEPTRFYLIDGKWYVESYWMANARNGQ